MTSGRHERGFTVVELMVVVAIVGVLAALMFGMITRPVGANARTTSEKIVSTLRFAKSRAIATRTIHRVTIEPTQLIVEVAQGTGLGTPTWHTVPLQTVRLPSGITIWDALDGANAVEPTTPTSPLAYELVFRPDGQVRAEGVAQSASIFVTDSAQSSKYRIRIYPTTGGAYARANW